MKHEPTMRIWKRCVNWLRSALLLKGHKSSAGRQVSAPTLSLPTQQQATPSWSIYSDAHVPLSVFMDCLEGELYGLIRRGEPPQEALQNAWNSIYKEYCELVNDGHVNEVFELYRDIERLRAQCAYVDAALVHLALAPDEEILGHLRKLGLRPNINDLTACHDRARKWLIDIEIKQKALSKLQVKTEGKRGGRSYYEDWLLAMGNRQGHIVRAADISLYQFIKLQKDIEAEALRKKMKAA